jgi:hypothetical protein
MPNKLRWRFPWWKFPSLCCILFYSWFLFISTTLACAPFSNPFWYITSFLYSLLHDPGKGHHPSLFPVGEDWTLFSLFVPVATQFNTPLHSCTTTTIITILPCFLLAHADSTPYTSCLNPCPLSQHHSLHPEDGGNMALWNFGILPHYIVP